MLIIVMHPVQDRLFLPFDLFGPLAGLLLPGADHVQGLKSFSAPGMFGFDGQPPDVFSRLVPFFKVWVDHCSTLG